VLFPAKYRCVKTCTVILFLISVIFCEFLDAQQPLSLLPTKKVTRIRSFVADGLTTTFDVDTTVVFIDSVKVIHRGADRGRAVFSFNRGKSQIILEDVPPDSAIVIIYGKISPVNLSLRYVMHEKIMYEGDSLGRQSEFTEVSAEPLQDLTGDNGLFRSGSLTRAFSFGTNRGLELQSGLRMQVRGKISSDYEMQAVLTDQNTPLQPEGNTRTLSEVDKVFIDITGPQFSSRFGDIDVSEKQTVFGQYTRKLKGMSAVSNVRKHSVDMTFASSEGQYHSQRINGINGSQGPYFLSGKNGERDIVVLAGTEKVYIDGEPVLRGEDADYVIDYSTGQITFTRNRLITEYTRITVDFEYSDGSFKKSVFGINVKNNPARTGLSYSASFLRESDGKDNPQDITFNDDDLSKLSGAGDDPALAYRSGTEYVGSGNGSYELIQNGGETYYAYKDSGDYKVVFSDVGEGKGDYEFKRINEYEYVGRANGRFLPVVSLPLPESHSMSNVSVGYTDSKNRMSVKGEFAYSMADNNTFSDLDDGNNGGNAMFMEFALNPYELGMSGANLGTASLQARMRRTGSSFRQIDRSTEVEFDRKWNLDNLNATGEELFEIESEYKPLSNMSVRPSIGYMKIGDDFRTSRQALNLGLGEKDASGLQYNIENISSTKSGVDDNWVRQKGSASVLYKGFRPMLLFESESKKEEYDITQGFSFTDWAARLDYRHSNSFYAYGQYQERKDKSYIDNDLSPLSRARNFIVHTEVRSGQRLFSQVQIVRRIRKDKIDNSEKVTDLADIKIQSKEMNGGIAARLNMQISDENMPKKEKVYIPVEQGKGFFSYDSLTGEYFNDNYGSYILRTFTTDILQGVTRKKIGLTLDLIPEKFTDGSGASDNVLKSVRLQSIFRFENGTGESNLGELEVDEAAFKMKSLLQDLFIMEKSEKFNVRLRQQYNYVLNNQYLSRAEERTQALYSARIRSRCL